MASLVQFGTWLATQVFDVVGQVAGQAAADGGAYSDTVDLQVGKTVYHDVPASMRTELWLSQLQRKSARGPAVMAEYRDSLFETLAPEVLGEIEKDTHRTFPHHPRLSTEEGQRAMLNVLRAYALSDPEIGYTQGMNFLAGLLLTYLPTEAEAYCALSLLMRGRGLREMYLPDMACLQIRLWQLSKLLPPRLAAHLEAHAVLPVLYASSWLITCFASDFPFHFSARIMDVLLTGHHVASPVLKIAVALVTSCQHDLLNMHDFEEMVQYLRQDVPRWPKRALQDLLTDALSKPWSARQLKVLEQINGAESVMEAVARVNNLVQQPTVEAAEVAAVLEQVGSSATAGRAAPAEAQQAEESRAEPSPRTVARSLSNSFRRPPLPLPPPPRGKADAVQWDAWQAPDRLASVGPQQVRIEQSIGEVNLLDLDPQLSKALLAYPHFDAPSAAPSFAPFQAAQKAGSGTSARAQAAGAAAAGSGGQTGQQVQQAQQAELETASSSTSAAQRAAGAAELSPRSPPADPADVQQRWDAFSAQSNKCLLSAPSPFDSPAPMRAAGPPLRLSTTFDVAQLAALRQQAAAAAAAGAAGGQQGPGQSPQPQLQPQQQSAPAPELAGSYGSFQLAEQPSARPLVLPSSQQQSAGSSGSAGGQDSGGMPASGFLGMFRRSATPEKQASGGQAAAAAADSDLIQDVPSSHGSSLAAVLSQLGLSGPGGSAGARSTAAAGPSQRRLQHSGEGDEFGSFKTAQGSVHEASAQSSGAMDPHPTGGDSSWHSAASHGSSQQAAGAAGPRGSGALSSTASSSLPAVQQPVGRAPGSADGAQAAPAEAAGAPSRWLSSAAANQRASSLQEEHLHGFLSSGQEQASRAAPASRARLGSAT